MPIHNYYTATAAVSALTATGTGTEIDLRKYFVSPGKCEVKAILGSHFVKTASSDTGTMDVKFQQSSTSVDSDFADITGAAFTQVSETNTGACEQIHFLVSKAYLREAHTITTSGGTFYTVIPVLVETRVS